MPIFSLILFNNDITLAEVAESKLPVGSSHKITEGLWTIARAIATRCCCPPDNSLGRCSLRSPRPTAFSASSAVFLESVADLPSNSNGNSTFSTADNTGSKLKS